MPPRLNFRTNFYIWFGFTCVQIRLMKIRIILKQIQSCQASLLVMFELWYTKSELLLCILTGCPHSQAPEARSVVERSEPRVKVSDSMKKVFATSGIHMTYIWPKWSKCYRRGWSSLVWGENFFRDNRVKWPSIFEFHRCSLCLQLVSILKS